VPFGFCVCVGVVYCEEVVGAAGCSSCFLLSGAI
jgi:hypothetical protein